MLPPYQRLHTNESRIKYEREIRKVELIDVSFSDCENDWEIALSFSVTNSERDLLKF
jgi:hypothetical protein